MREPQWIDFYKGFRGWQSVLNTVEKVLLLQDLELFRQVSTEHLARLAVVARERDIKSGQSLFRPQEPVSRAFFLVEGRVRLKPPEDSPFVVERSLLDTLAVLSGGPHLVRAETVDACTLLVVSYDDLVELLTDEAEFCWALLRHVAGQACAGGKTGGHSDELD